MLDYVRVINILFIIIVIINYSLRTRSFAQSSTKKDQRTEQKNSNIQPNLHIHQASGTPNQQLNTAA